MNRYLTEFIGTFFLVLTISLTVLSGSSMAPLAIGASLMVMVYMGGHISGAHYNPAVSLAVWLRGKLGVRDLGMYMMAQIFGGLAAAMLALVIAGRTAAIAPGKDVSMLAALLVEVLFTFALALVVLNAATAAKTEGNSFYGLAIGFTVVVGAFAGGGLSGGAFNPAVGIGLTLAHGLLGGGVYSYLWLYIAGPLMGGILAAGVFKIQEGWMPVPQAGQPLVPGEVIKERV